LQTAEDLQAAAHFNNTVEFSVDKYGPLSKERTTGEVCVLTKWRGFDEAESTEEPIYEKWVDTPRLLKDHLQLLADKGDELAIQSLEKVKEWEDNSSDNLPGTTGDTNPNSYDYDAPRKSKSNYLHLLNLCFAMGRCCVTSTRVPYIPSTT
jgi:hypothetical protein